VCVCVCVCVCVQFLGRWFQSFNEWSYKFISRSPTHSQATSNWPCQKGVCRPTDVNLVNLQLHNDSDRIHHLTPQTKLAGNQNNTQLLQQRKNSVFQTAKKLQHLYSRMQKSPTLIMWIWVQQSMETPYVTWCNNSQEDSEDAFCKVWSFQHENATHTHHTEATWVAAVISVGICGPSTL